MAEKIATCCYCNATTVFSLRDKGRQELACSACGAPLSNLKAVPQSAQPAQKAESKKPAKSQKKKKTKKKRSPGQRLFAEVVDFVEDIFD